MEIIGNCYICNKEVIRKRKHEKYICDDCKKEYHKKYHKEYYENNKEYLNEQKKEYYKENKKDIREQQKEYNEKNRDKKKEYDKEYNQRSEVKERRRVQQKEYRSRPEVKQRRNEREKERYNTDPIFKFECCTRRLTNYGFKKCALGLDAKSGSTEFYLGCTFKQAWKIFKEKMDKRGMTVEDFLKGRVHIDHIKPRAAFPDLSKLKQAKECFNYKNLQPLWAKENLEKSAKLDWKNST